MFARPPSASRIAQTQALAPNSTSGYVVWLPSDQPIGPPSAKGGADPLELTPAGDLVPLFEYQPRGSFAEAIVLGNRGRWQAAAKILRSLGVAMLVDRRDILSYRHSTTPRPHRVRESADLRKHGAASAYDVYWIVRPLGFMSLETRHYTAGFRGHPLPRSLIHDQPNDRDFVAAFPFYDLSPAIAQCGSEAVLAYSAAYLRTSYRWFLAAPATLADGCRWISRNRIRRFPPNTLVVAAGWADSKVPNQVDRGIPRQLGIVTIERHTNDVITGSYESPAPASLVLRTSFDSRWTLYVDRTEGLSSKQIDGYANGWDVGPGKHHFVARFGPTSQVRALLVICAMWIAGLVVAAIFLARKGAGLN